MPLSTMMSASALPPSPLPGSTCPAPALVPPPSTPPPPPNPSLPIHKSSPVKCPPYHVDHSRAEVEMGLYQADDYPLCPEQPDEFVKSLERAGTIPPAPEDLKVALSFQNFVEPINDLLKTIKSMRECHHSHETCHQNMTLNVVQILRTCVTVMGRIRGLLFCDTVKASFHVCIPTTPDADPTTPLPSSETGRTTVIYPGHSSNSLGRRLLAGTPIRGRKRSHTFITL